MNTLAPTLRRSRRHSSWALVVTTWRGVLPNRFAVSGLQPSPSSRTRACTRPYLHASWTAVLPRTSAAFKSGASLSSASRIPASPGRLGRASRVCRGVRPSGPQARTSALNCSSRSTTAGQDARHAMWRGVWPRPSLAFTALASDLDTVSIRSDTCRSDTFSSSSEVQSVCRLPQGLRVSSSLDHAGQPHHSPHLLSPCCPC
mmetsp:Transcript_50819/g.90798  ORF Transcript_50819/g.90798 Transcript_50819/m.90798 type:complete len:202 (+) Transcript_50819:928-1533(+)